MIYRTRDEIAPVDWGNGESHRLLVEADGMGFAVAHTIVRAGTMSRLQYRRHLEACYCISGSGEVRGAEDGTVYKLVPGVLYALNENDPHTLSADHAGDLHLISIFNPPIAGHERHTLDRSGYSQY
ncbi:ectoine synthase [Nocardia sp. NPDC057227]|uniref:ectoine synthase n=1 Tax=Nocardia sp. NPDC057227 TaxID=3346056 RepID=UPI0036402494